jgi:hypothetical protein
MKALIALGGSLWDYCDSFSGRTVARPFFALYYYRHSFTLIFHQICMSIHNFLSVVLHVDCVKLVSSTLLLLRSNG